jgi:hypothetical protein
MEPQLTWADAASAAARRLAVITAAGALVGLIVAGGGSRLAMSLLSALNPEADGIQSDDDFTIGQVTGATLNLLLVTTLIGIFGAGVYAAVRGLRTGWGRFDLLALTAGPAVVIGAIIVKTDGVDFTVLDPAPLAIALFLTVPAAYCLALVLLAERWLRPEGAWSRAGRWGYLPLALWIPLFPVLGVLAVGWAIGQAVQRAGGRMDHPALLWTARAGLVVVFALGLADLGRDTADLT